MARCQQDLNLDAGKLKINFMWPYVLATILCITTAQLAATYILVVYLLLSV